MPMLPEAILLSPRQPPGLQAGLLCTIHLGPQAPNATGWDPQIPTGRNHLKTSEKNESKKIYRSSTNRFLASTTVAHQVGQAIQPVPGKAVCTGPTPPVAWGELFQGSSSRSHSLPLVIHLQDKWEGAGAGNTNTIPSEAGDSANHLLFSHC